MNDEQQLEVCKARVDAYNRAIELIDRMMPEEPFRVHSEMRDQRAWESETRTLRALKCDIYKELISATGEKTYYENKVAEAIREAHKEG